MTAPLTGSIPFLRHTFKPFKIHFICIFTKIHPDLFLPLTQNILRLTKKKLRFSSFGLIAYGEVLNSLKVLINYHGPFRWIFFASFATALLKNSSQSNQTLTHFNDAIRAFCVIQSGGAVWLAHK